MKSGGIEFRACPCGAQPELASLETAARAKVVLVSCPVCGLSNSAAYGPGGPTRKEALVMLAEAWNGR